MLHRMVHCFLRLFVLLGQLLKSLTLRIKISLQVIIFLDSDIVIIKCVKDVLGFIAVILNLFQNMIALV